MREPDAPARCRARRGAISALFAVLATIYNVTTPPWEAPDEVAHFAYAEHLARHRTLPVPDHRDAGEAHQPPLYYLAVAAAIARLDLDDPSGRFRFNRRVRIGDAGGDDVNIALHGSDEAFPYRGVALALHVARAVSTVFGTLTVGLAIALGGTILGRHGSLALLPGALVALNPQFQFISGSVSNDTLATTLYTATLLALVRAHSRPASALAWIAAGVLSGAALVTKLTTVALVPLAGLALALSARALPPILVARNAMLVYGSLLAVSGWWFARNHVLLGDPLGLTWASRAFGRVLRSQPLQPGDLLDFAWTQFRSFWALFGWMTVPAPTWLYGLLASFTAVALAGFALVACGRARLRVDAAQRRALGLLLAAILLQEGFLLAAIQRFDASWYQGRYLFPVIAPIAIVLSLGVLGRAPQHLWRPLALGVGLALLSVSVAVPWLVLAAAYDRAPAAARAAGG